MKRSFVVLAVVASMIVTTGPAARAASGGTIAGTVTDRVTSAPVGGVCVDAYDSQWDLWEVTTSTDGTYSIGDLPADSYTLDFYDCEGSRYAEQWYDDKPTQDQADPVAVTDGNTSTANAALDPNGAISGTVTDENGAGATACIEAWSDNGYGQTWSNSDGTYEIDGLAPGSYTVHFVCSNYSPPPIAYQRPPVTSSSSASSAVPAAPSDTGYVPQYYDDASSPSGAAPVAVTNGATTPGINATLQIAGAISGTVTDAAGKGLSGICVEADPRSGDAQWNVSQTYDDGTYTITNLAPGAQWVVSFSDCNTGVYSQQYYDHVSNQSAATPVSVSKGEFTNGIDATLSKRPRPDAAVADLSVENVPVKTDVVTGPSLGTQRVVHVDVANLGSADTSWPVVLDVTVTTKSDNHVTWLDSETFQLSAGQRISRALDWNAIGSIGDATISAQVCTWDDADSTNDARSMDSYAVVGGTGIGMTFASLPSGPSDQRGCDQFPPPVY